MMSQSVKATSGRSVIAHIEALGCSVFKVLIQKPPLQRGQRPKTTISKVIFHHFHGKDSPMFNAMLYADTIIIDLM